MEFTASHKQEIEGQIVDIIASALEKTELKEEDLAPISTFVLKYIDAIKTQDELVYFLRHLSARWPLFKQLLEVEKGQVKEQQEKQALQGALGLAKSGKLEDAITLAKSATNT